VSLLVNFGIWNADLEFVNSDCWPTTNWPLRTVHWPLFTDYWHTPTPLFL